MGGAPLARPHLDRPANVRRTGAVTAARLLLWVAALLPFIYSTSRTASDLAAGEGIGPLEILRGGGPAVLWGFSVLLAPTVRRGIGIVEIAMAAFCTVIVISVLIPANPGPQSSLLKSSRSSS